MSNKASILLNFVVGIFQDMPLVNTVVFKDDDVVDVEKENVYPLVSIELIETPPTENDYYYEKLGFTVLNQRDDLKVATPSKLMTDTNYIDNVGIVRTIMNNFILEVEKTHNEFDIDIFEKTPGIPLKKDERNCLDGIRFEATFSMHQNAI